MPRKSQVDTIIEKNHKTFAKYPVFVIWARKHLKNYENVDKYEEAFKKFHAKDEVEESDNE